MLTSYELVLIVVSQLEFHFTSLSHHALAYVHIRAITRTWLRMHKRDKSMRTFILVCDHAEAYMYP